MIQPERVFTICRKPQFTFTEELRDYLGIELHKAPHGHQIEQWSRELYEIKD